MKLFLSSKRLPNQSEQHELFGDKVQPSVIIIPNAWDPYPKQQAKAELATTITAFGRLNYKTTTLNLVTSSYKQKGSALESHDFVWIMGGNSFYLNYYMQQDSFDKALATALDSGLVYGGASAGAVVTGPTLHGIENADNPHDAPQIIWNGLGLVDFGIVPHWGLEKYGDTLAKVASEMERHVGKVVRLTNVQAMIVDGTSFEVHE